MDAAGKDSSIRHVMSGVNPQGCEVFSFKQPSAEELAHDFLWRTTRRLPERGRIGIFNRSYYEEVLIVVEGRSTEGRADCLCLSVSAMKSRLLRARVTPRRALAAYRDNEREAAAGVPGKGCPQAVAAGVRRSSPSRPHGNGTGMLRGPLNGLH
jgi:hypothetical protein